MRREKCKEAKKDTMGSEKSGRRRGSKLPMRREKDGRERGGGREGESELTGWRDIFIGGQIVPKNQQRGEEESE